MVRMAAGDTLSFFARYITDDKMLLSNPVLKLPNRETESNRDFGWEIDVSTQVPAGKLAVPNRMYHAKLLRKDIGPFCYIFSPWFSLKQKGGPRIYKTFKRKSKAINEPSDI